MKRSVKIGLLAIIISVIVLTLVGVFSRHSSPRLSYSFLGGRDPGMHIKGKTKILDRNRRTRDWYCFPADFNSVCLDADAELSSLGFVENSPAGHEPRIRRYVLRSKLPDELVHVQILDKHKLSEYSTPERVAYHYRNGWVSVEIMQERRRSWLW